MTAKRRETSVETSSRFLELRAGGPATTPVNRRIPPAMMASRPPRAIKQSPAERIAELETALHEALNWWSADMPDPDENRDRLRKIAEGGA